MALADARAGCDPLQLVQAPRGALDLVGAMQYAAARQACRDVEREKAEAEFETWIQYPELWTLED